MCAFINGRRNPVKEITVNRLEVRKINWIFCTTTKTNKQEQKNNSNNTVTLFIKFSPCLECCMRSSG